jgi:hypothetical protein
MSTFSLASLYYIYKEKAGLKRFYFHATPSSNSLNKYWALLRCQVCSRHRDVPEIREAKIPGILSWYYRKLFMIMSEKWEQV